MSNVCAGLTRSQANQLYYEVMADKDTEVIQRLCLEDLFFLLTVACNKTYVDKDFCYDACREVEAHPDGYLDLWSREHYKTTIISFGLSIQDILNDAEVTIGIFSVNRSLSKSILFMIKTELESNELLKAAFPDVLYAEPHKHSPRWSLENGLIVRRKGNPRESTVDAWGFIEALPTGSHYVVRLYDDIIDERHAPNPDIRKKARSQLKLSFNLGREEGGKARFVGTRYHAQDPYQYLLEKGLAIPRIKAGTDTGTMEGKPLMWTRKILERKRVEMGPYIFACQILQNPTAEEVQSFLAEWVLKREFDVSAMWNLYIISDPANEKKTENDYTVTLVIGLGPDLRYYLIDGFRDRLNLTERTSRLFRLVRKYHPIAVGYEKDSLNADIQHIEYVMEIENYRFNIIPLPKRIKKEDRIRRLVPVFEQHRFILPMSLMFMGYDKKVHDLVQEFLDEEYFDFPMAPHDDIFDDMSQILEVELGAEFPLEDDTDCLPVGVGATNMTNHQKSIWDM